METLGYDLYWHPAPMFETDNYFGNPVNHWAPDVIASQMVLGLPSERRATLSALRKIQHKDEWWEGFS